MTTTNPPADVDEDDAPPSTRSRWTLRIETELPNPTEPIMRAADVLVDVGKQHGALVDIDLADDGENWIDGRIFDPDDEGQRPVDQPSPPPAPAVPGVNLAGYKAASSGDPAKQVLELVHEPCGAVLCDVEPGDELQVLVAVAIGHAPDCESGSTTC